MSVSRTGPIADARCFNSNMVRLDVFIESLKNALVLSFNSNMVRLDGSGFGPREWWNGFQFQYGAIR